MLPAKDGTTTHAGANGPRNDEGQSKKRKREIDDSGKSESVISGDSDNEIDRDIPGRTSKRKSRKGDKRAPKNIRMENASSNAFESTSQFRKAIDCFQTGLSVIKGHEPDWLTAFIASDGVEDLGRLADTQPLQSAPRKDQLELMRGIHNACHYVNSVVTAVDSRRRTKTKEANLELLKDVGEDGFIWYPDIQLCSESAIPSGGSNLEDFQVFTAFGQRYLAKFRPLLVQDWDGFDVRGYPTLTHNDKKLAYLPQEIARNRMYLIEYRHGLCQADMPPDQIFIHESEETTTRYVSLDKVKVDLNLPMSAGTGWVSDAGLKRLAYCIIQREASRNGYEVDIKLAGPGNENDRSDSVDHKASGDRDAGLSQAVQYSAGYDGLSSKQQQPSRYNEPYNAFERDTGAEWNNPHRQEHYRRELFDRRDQDRGYDYRREDHYLAPVDRRGPSEKQAPAPPPERRQADSYRPPSDKPVNASSTSAPWPRVAKLEAGDRKGHVGSVNAQDSQGHITPTRPTSRKTLNGQPPRAPRKVVSNSARRETPNAAATLQFLFGRSEQSSLLTSSEGHSRAGEGLAQPHAEETHQKPHPSIQPEVSASTALMGPPHSTHDISLGLAVGNGTTPSASESKAAQYGAESSHTSQVSQQKSSPISDQSSLQDADIGRAVGKDEPQNGGIAAPSLSTAASQALQATTPRPYTSTLGVSALNLDSDKPAGYKDVSTSSSSRFRQFKEQ